MPLPDESPFHDQVPLSRESLEAADDVERDTPALELSVDFDQLLLDCFAVRVPPWLPDVVCVQPSTPLSFRATFRVTVLEVLVRSSVELKADPLPATMPAVPRSSVPLEPEDDEWSSPLPFSVRSVVTTDVETPALELVRLEPTEVAEYVPVHDVLSLDTDPPVCTAPLAETTSDDDCEELDESDVFRPLIDACWFDEEVLDLSVG